MHKLYPIVYFQNPETEPNYQVYLKSKNGPIYVLLVNQEHEHQPPLVIQVLHYISYILK